MPVIPTPLELAEKVPQNEAQRTFITQSRKSIEDILNGQDGRMILVVGPCSIHDADSAYAFAEKLKNLSKEVEDRFFIVMRTYFEKPRTGRGWKGFLYDPDLDGSYNIAKGLFSSRVILRDLCEMGLPTAAEFLEINTANYLVDFLSWGCIGARTCSSQPHRQLASALPLPIGFKNSTEGNILPAINGILSAKSSHIFLGMNEEGKFSRLMGKGNKHAHLVLRGGDLHPNYDPLSVADAMQKCENAGISTKIFIDCSHGNSGKCANNQISVFDAVMKQQNPKIAGVMLESHLEAGSQAITSDLRHGVSVTDPCLDWETTQRLILGYADASIY